MKYGAIGIRPFHFAHTARDWEEICQSMSDDKLVKRLTGAGTGKVVAAGFTTGQLDAGGKFNGQGVVLFVRVGVAVVAFPPLSTASQHVVLALPPESVAGGLVFRAWAVIGPVY